MFTLADALNLLGKTGDSRKIVEEIKNKAHDSITRARCDIYTAFCLRAEGKPEEALSCLCAAPANHPQSGNMPVFAKLSASSILVSLSKGDDALSLIAEAGETNEFLSIGYRSRYLYPPFLIKEEYAKAAETLLIDSNVNDSYLARHAEQAIKAALIIGMTGDVKECGRILKKTARRYPDTRVRYFSALAHALEQGIRNTASPGWADAISSCLEKLPYPAYVRSELFYLAGLLLIKQGETIAGKTLLRRCAEEDRTNQWPAVLAQKEINDPMIIVP